MQMTENTDYPKELLDNLPNPTTFRILIAMPMQKETSDGGIILPEKLREREHTASIMGYVLKLGPDAFGDTARFPHGAACSAGDFVMVRPFSGTRFKLGEQEFRLINDDSVEAVVPNPTLIERA